MIKCDGARSMNKIWFANKLLRELDGDGRKRTEIDGFSVSVWSTDGYEGGRIESPPGIAVLADTATGYDLYFSSPIGADPIKASSPSLGARRGAYLAPYSIPHAAMVPVGIEFVDTYFDRFPDASPAGNAALRARWIALGIRVAALQVEGLAYTAPAPAMSGSLASSPVMSVFAEVGYADGASIWTLAINVVAAGGGITLNLSADALAAYFPGMVAINSARCSKVDDTDTRVFLTYATASDYGVCEIAVLFIDGMVNVYALGYQTGGLASDAAAIDGHCMPLALGGSVIDYAAVFQDAAGRMCWMPVSGGILRYAGTGFESIATGALPAPLLAHGVYDVTLANGGGYALIRWYHNPLSNPAAVQALHWGDPFTGVWAEIILPAGVMTSIRPLHCSDERQVFLSVVYAEGESAVYVLDTNVSHEWRRVGHLSTDRLDHCAIAPFGAHAYTSMLANYPSAQHVMEKFA